jgi:hypothetical protein
MPQKRDVNRDSMDFRDLIYRPALVRLRDKVLPKWAHLQILDQENEGACTGFGLAAVINYLNWENGEKVRVSQRMLFEMAKRHDQWPGHNYDWSSARGAMKGWHKNGVCPEKVWPYDPKKPGILTEQRQNAALSHRLGAYYRVMPRRSDVHAALNEVSVVFASAATHKGWDEMGKSHIPYDSSWPEDGGHAFAIIGYTDDGFLVQNSWGRRWGNIRIGKRSVKGVAVWSYDDFERNVWDLWVARLARPLDSNASLRTAKYTQSSGGTRLSSSGPERHTIRDHYLHIDDGQYDPKGDYPTLAAEAEDILDRAVNGADGKSAPAHLLLYAHGGLNSIKDSAARVGKWREVFRDNGIHEVHFIWETGMLDELRDVLFGKQHLAQERVGGASDWWDTVLEKTTHPLGYALWKEMRTDADLAFQDERAGTHALETLARLLGKLPAAKRPKLHLAGHSAGSIWHGHLLDRWTALQGPPIENLVLFAPACTHELFDRNIRTALAAGRVGKLHHFLLDDKTEKDDNVVAVYRKSLLYLVSNSFQRHDSVEPIMGMQKFLDKLPVTGIQNKVATYLTNRDREKTASTSHGGFDNDEKTMNAMLEFVLGSTPSRRFSRADLTGY